MRDLGTGKERGKNRSKREKPSELKKKKILESEGGEER
jgi:hypothetical protein